MALGKIFEEVKDLLTGTPEQETPQNADVNADPAFASLRSDARFQEILRHFSK